MRCGILHQGETYNGWKIIRTGKILNNKTINATKFLKALDSTLKKYRDELKTNKTLFKNCQTKIQHIIKNSQ